MAAGRGPSTGDRFEDVISDLILARGELPAEVLRLVVDEVLAFQDGRARDDATLLLVGWRVPPTRDGSWIERARAG